MRTTEPNKSLFTVGESLTKDSQNALYRARWPKLFLSLDAYPLHSFSEAGRASICQRHKITDTQLEAALLAYVHPEAPTEAQQAADLTNLVGVIQDVVKPTPKRKASPKKKGARKP
jgi:hypothetical protein